MPYTLLISVIIGVTNIVPFFGPFIGAIPSAFLILLIDPIKALYFVVIIVILQQFDGNVLGPIILGNSTGLSGFWVIFSIMLFGGIWGIPGVFLGVPTFACIYAWFRRFMRGSLTDKQLSIDTDDYMNLDYIDSNNVIHSKTVKEKISFNNEKRYTQIALSDDLKNQTDDNNNSSVKDALSGIFNRVKTYNEKILSKDKSDDKEDEIVIPLDNINVDETETNDENADI